MEGCSIYAIRFQHGFLSRGGRRRNLPPDNARAEGFISFHLIKPGGNARRALFIDLITRFRHGAIRQLFIGAFSTANIARPY